MATSLMDKIREYLDAEGCDYEEEESIFHTVLGGDNGTYDVAIAVSDEDDLIEVYVLHDLCVPEDKRLAVAEYITRMNSRFGQAKYEFDMDTGELEVACIADLTNTTPSPELIEILIQLPAAVADTGYPGLVAVVQGDKSPKAAAEEPDEE